MELLVGLMLLAIIATAAGSSLSPMLKIYARANDMAEWNTLLDNIANRMISDLSQATVPLDFTVNPVTNDDITIVIDGIDVDYSISADGILLINGNPFLEKNYYKQKSVNFSCRPEGPDVAYILTITISHDRGGEAISRDYAVRPLVLNSWP